MAHSTSADLVLGIDLGTTSVKVCIIRQNDQSLVRSVSKDTDADVKSDHKDGSEQCPLKILNTVQTCLLEIPEAEQKCIRGIGVTGQMHGVVLWTNKKDNFYKTGQNGDSCFCLGGVSNLFTWQDQRCSPDFLSLLPIPSSQLPLSTGHGCATVYWFAKEDPNFLSDGGFKCAGTIMDLLVAILCGLDHPVTTDQLAASFGYFNSKYKSWNTQIRRDGFPMDILPEVIPSGKTAGTLAFDWLHISAGIPVMAALGDVQCAVYSVVRSHKDAVLNMSTSSQLMFPMMQQDLIPDHADSTSAIQYFPYFNEGYLAMAASLNGGNVLTMFVKMLKQWMSCLDVIIPEEQIWTKLLEHGISSSSSSSSSSSCGPNTTPLLYGERHCPERNASVSAITPNNLDLGTIFRSVCTSLIENLCQMMPISFLKQHGIENLIATGSVLSRNPIICEEVRKCFGCLEIHHGDSCDSALGAAMCCVNYITE